MDQFSTTRIFPHALVIPEELSDLANFKPDEEFTKDLLPAVQLELTYLLGDKPRIEHYREHAEQVQHAWIFGNHWEYNFMHKLSFAPASIGPANAAENLGLHILGMVASLWTVIYEGQTQSADHWLRFDAIKLTLERIGLPSYSYGEPNLPDDIMKPILVAGSLPEIERGKLINPNLQGQPLRGLYDDYKTVGGKLSDMAPMLQILVDFYRLVNGPK